MSAMAEIARVTLEGDHPKEGFPQMECVVGDVHIAFLYRSAPLLHLPSADGA
jgi:hypothetical protein